MTMLIYAGHITPRLRYIARTLLGEVNFIESPAAFHDSTEPKINYSHKRISAGEFFIPPAGLLSETSTRDHAITCGDWNGLKTFLPGRGDMPFDIFSAAFFLLSRYEEYLPHRKDSYGRFAHEESLAWREGFLHLPLVDLWRKEFINLLQQKFPQFSPAAPVFSFQPTYDIDIAYAAKGKGWMRKLAAMLKRTKTSLHGRDLFDVYDWLDHLHQRHPHKPIYFFLAARRRSKYDKNISPRSPVFKRLVKQIGRHHRVGVHPSWESHFDGALIKTEKATIEAIVGKTLDCARQHYIKITLPDTYRAMIAAGITRDYSMGYGSINGFRASTSRPFYWYDLLREEETGLLLHPFCYMEANSFFEQGYAAQEAALELQRYHDVVQAVDGQLITIFHNHFLTEEDAWLPWRAMYEEFLQRNFNKAGKVTSPSLPEQ